MRDPYEILQVSPRAEIEVIEAAYRRLARKYHPDTNRSPDATARMKDINWAYDILRDPLERARYDRQRRAARAAGAAAGTAAPPQRPAYPPPRAAPAPPRPSSPPPPSPPVRRTFLQRYWLPVGVLLGAYYLTVIQPQLVGSPSPSSLPLFPSRTPTPWDPYKDCIHWTSAGLFDGERKCVLGRIMVVTEEFDELSGMDISTAHFSFNPDADFVLISVDRDISRWEGQCVAVYGTLFERDRVAEYAQNLQPSMIDSDPFDERGFSITAAPQEHCR